MPPPPGSGTASANPEMLYVYSDTCTRAAQDLQNWVRGVLAPALRRYLQGAAARSEGTNIDLRTVNQLAGAVQERLPQHIATLYYTDRDVHRVGGLFAQAGQAGALDPGLGAGVPDRRFLSPINHVVHTDDQTIDDWALHDGGSLATQIDPLAPSTEQGAAAGELYKQADDPLFCAGFFNGLTTEQLQVLPRNAAMIQALVSAFRSGRLTDQAQARIVSYLRYHPGYETAPGVLAALAADPHAAANFAVYLMKNGTKLTDLMSEPTAFRQKVMRMLTSAESVMTSNQLSDLLKAFGRNLPHMSLSDERALDNELSAFLSRGVSRLLDDPPLPYPPGTPYRDALTTWVERYGSAVHSSLEPYRAWLQRIYEDSRTGKQDLHNFAENVVLGVVGGIATAPLSGPAAIVMDGLYGGGAGFAMSKLDPLISKLLHWSVGPESPPASLDPENFLRKAAFLSVVVNLYGQRGERPLLGILHDPGLAHVLSLVERGERPDDQARTWLHAQKLPNTHDGELDDLFNALT